MCRWCPISACVHTAHRRPSRNTLSRRPDDLNRPERPILKRKYAKTFDYRVRCFSRFSSEQIRVIPPQSRPSCSRLLVRSPVSAVAGFRLLLRSFFSKNRRRTEMEAVKAFTFEVSQTNAHHTCGHLVNSQLLEKMLVMIPNFYHVWMRARSLSTWKLIFLSSQQKLTDQRDLDSDTVCTEPLGRWQTATLVDIYNTNDEIVVSLLPS